MLCGWLRFGLFWDSIPFMNMFFVLKNFQGKRLGRQFVEFWETEMKKQGYKMLMTSRLPDEGSATFLQKIRLYRL